jgi:hypothetical protein
MCPSRRRPAPCPDGLSGLGPRPAATPRGGPRARAAPRHARVAAAHASPRPLLYPPPPPSSCPAKKCSSCCLVSRHCDFKPPRRPAPRPARARAREPPSRSSARHALAKPGGAGPAPPRAGAGSLPFASPTPPRPRAPHLMGPRIAWAVTVSCDDVMWTFWWVRAGAGGPGRAAPVGGTAQPAAHTTRGAVRRAARRVRAARAAPRWRSRGTRAQRGPWLRGRSATLLSHPFRTTLPARS